MKLLAENRFIYFQFPSIWTKPLNTFRLETWTQPFQNKEDFFTKWTIEESKLSDSDFSFEKKQESWWKNYKDIELQTTNLDWTTRQIVIPWMVIWWMWTWVSSSSLIEAASKVWVWWHLSSIGIWWSYDDPSVYQWWDKFEKAYNQVENEFNSLFKDQLWLTDNQINKHLFECKEWLDENFWLTTDNQKEKMFRMKDLLAIYREAQDLKSKWINFGINAMYKTTSYVAVLKVATLAWIDYITTAAWNPNIHPRKIVTDFLQDTWKTDIQIPAFWLIVSIVRTVDTNYDYYIIEDPRFAWWHLWATDSMLERIPKKVWKEENLTTLRAKVWPDKPIIVAWWFNSAESIKTILDWWLANWIQIWTLAAVSEEAVNWWWKDFKERLISWNHIWPREEIDSIAEEEYRLVKENLYKAIWETRERLFNIAPEQLSDPKTLKVLKHIHKIIFQNFDKWTIWNLELWDDSIDSLEWEDKKLFNQVWWFLSNKFDDIWNEGQNSVLRWLRKTWNKIKLLVWIENQNKRYIDEIFRRYWNMLKLAKQFNEYDEKWIIPTHIVFDSVVWFDARQRLWRNDWKLCWEVINTRTCIWCLNSCLLAWRWKKDANDDVLVPSLADATAFCIVDWLEQWNTRRKLPIKFSWTTTVPYPDIRPFEHILAAMMWYEITKEAA